MPIRIRGFVTGLTALLNQRRPWAEAGWLAAEAFGADLVGMSTVYEAIAAREWGVELVGLSTVTAIEGTPQVKQWHSRGSMRPKWSGSPSAALRGSGRSWCDSSRRV